MKNNKLAWSFVAFVSAALAWPMAGTAATPTVNGLFYGDGDYANYLYLGENPGRGTIYYKQEGTMLYLAVLVSTNVNDNVFGDSKKNSPDRPYVESSGWNQHHTWGALLGSDHLEFQLEVGSSSWTWSQDYLYDADGDADPAENDWLSDANGSDGGGTPPPGLVSASSLQWNMNTNTWDVTLGGTRGAAAYKSPDIDSDNSVLDEGYPTFLNNSGVKWEWPLVYEMAVDIGPYGSNFTMEVVSAHNSPAKEGGEDVPISLYDFGDAPDSYGTTTANSGPSHKIILGSGPRLGSLIDAEVDGQPTALADGDDVNGSDDEDGLISISTLTPGSTGSIVVTGTAGAKLDGWIDFNSDGDFLDPGEQISTSTVLTGGNDTINFPVSVGAVFGVSSAMRLRVSTDGNLTPHGDAPDGEVEDYTLTASLGDYVWLDIEPSGGIPNGIQDVTEGGINGVTVELYDDSGSGTPVATTSTAGDGAYLFSGLAPGNYYVKFYLPSTNYLFSPQDQGVNDEKDSDADTTTGETILTTLSAGENDLSWDAGMYIPSTLVTLSSFGATLREGRVVIQWSTSSEQNALGFYLERLDEQSGEFVRVNADLIPASIFATGTVNYEAVDADAVPGETYQYRLVELETTGKVNTYGPYTVSTEGPGGDEADTGSAVVEQIEAAPEVIGLTAGSGHMVLRWTSAEGNTYRIERSDSVNGEFEVIASGIPATAPENVLVLVDGANSGFYRIVSE